MKIQDVKYKWSKLFAVKRLKSKTGIAHLDPLEQEELLTDLDQAAASIMELVDKWIPVSERLPEMFEYVLVCTGGIVLKGRKYDNGWTAFYADGEVKVSNDMPVTHWQPLPPIPSQSKTAKND